MEEGGKYQIKPDGSLIIRNLDFSDMGNYACLVKNDFGSDKIETFVYPVAVSKYEITIFSTEILMRKVDLGSFFVSFKQVKKYTNQRFKSKYWCRKQEIWLKFFYIV